MGIFDRTKQQKQAINTVVGCLALAVVLLVVLLFFKANQLANVNTEISSAVKIGPLNLLQIQKIPATEGGYQATIKIASGLFVYMGIWLLAAILLITYRHYNRHLE